MMPKNLPKLLALAAICPFIVCFTPPEEPGTHVSVSGGSGRFVTSPGCARPHRVDYWDGQAGVYHGKQLQGDWKTRFGAGADVHVYKSREKECTTDDCVGGDSAWISNPALFALAPYGTVDWKWAGLSVGGVIPSRFPKGGRLHNDITRSWMPLDFVSGSARIGPVDLAYASLDVQSGRPLRSDGGPVLVGMGGRVMETDLWAGTNDLGSLDGFAARIGRRYGPVGLRLSGFYSRSDANWDDSDDSGPPAAGERFSVKIPEYSFSLGLDYRLP